MDGGQRPSNLSRRAVILGTCAATVTVASGGASAAIVAPHKPSAIPLPDAALPTGATPPVKPPAPRMLWLYNVHTGESLKTVYAEGDVYFPEALREIYHLLRGHGADEVREIDRRLLDAVATLHGMIGANRPFEVFSAYRTPDTDAMLRRVSSRVARNSYHMKGMAVDIGLKGTSLRRLHRAAIALNAGGVGCCLRSSFIHMDVGPVRHW